MCLLSRAGVDRRPASRGCHRHRQAESTHSIQRTHLYAAAYAQRKALRLCMHVLDSRACRPCAQDRQGIQQAPLLVKDGGRLGEWSLSSALCMLWVTAHALSYAVCCTLPGSVQRATQLHSYLATQPAASQHKGTHPASQSQGPLVCSAEHTAVYLSTRSNSSMTPGHSKRCPCTTLMYCAG